MKRDIIIAAVFIATVGALVALNYRSFRTGYRLGKEIWRPQVIVVPQDPPKQCKPQDRSITL